MSYTREEVEKKVKEIVSDKLNTNIDSINENTSLYNDLGADSLDNVELVMAFEDEFDIEILDSEWQVDNDMAIKEVVDKLFEKVNK